MINMLRNLSPRFEKKGEVLISELETFDEVLFMSKGKIDIGFEINKVPKMALRFENGVVIGSYNCLFN